CLLRRPGTRWLFVPADLPHGQGFMGRKVTFTPERFLKKIWQLGSFDVSPDGRRLAYSANKGEQWSVFILDIRTKREKPLLRSDQSIRSEEHTSELQSRVDLVCRLLLEKKTGPALDS